MIDQDMDEAKKMLPALVGRDTASLTRAQATSAVIESLSENYVDSILSPIFYYLLFAPFGLGLEAALAFKAISTMDSMLGYKTQGLRELGYAGAKLDDLANFIPARLSIFFMALARPAQGRRGTLGGLHNIIARRPAPTPAGPCPPVPAPWASAWRSPDTMCSWKMERNRIPRMCPAPCGLCRLSLP